MYISFTVSFLFVFLRVCTDTNFSTEDKVSGVKFYAAVHLCLRQGITNFCELCAPKSPILDESASTRTGL